MDKCQAVSQSNASNLMDTNVRQTCIFLTMERLGSQNIDEEDKTGKWCGCFDFEAYQEDFDDRVDDVEMLEEGTSWNKIHVPVSFSVGYNLEGVKTEHKSSKDPCELLAQFGDVLAKKNMKHVLNVMKIFLF